jgi:hypothetical protein
MMLNKNPTQMIEAPEGFTQKFAYYRWISNCPLGFLLYADFCKEFASMKDD